MEAWAEYGSDPPDQGEREALEWLERQPPPTITAPEGSSRSAIGLHVPVNNATDPTTADRKRGVSKYWKLLPEERKRSPRMSVQSTLVSGDGRVVFAWPESELADAQRGTLEAMLGRITRMGHSSSFVACRLIDDPPDPVWVPRPGSAGANGARPLRSTYAGMLEALIARHDTYSQTGLRNIPMTCSTVFYERVSSRAPAVMPSRDDTGDEWVVFEMERPSRHLPSTKAASVAKALRGALIKHCSKPPPKLLVGKDSDGRPTADPHAMFLLMPFVGHRHSDGAIKGAAVVLPPGTGRGEQRLEVLRAVGAWEDARCPGRPLKLHLGRLGVLELRRVSGPDASSLRALDREVWCRPARRWGSVTALALPREAHKLTQGCPSDIRRAWHKAEEAVLEACGFAGLPVPVSLDVGFDPPVRGGSHARDYPAFFQGGKKRLMLHAVVEFGEPVAGPVVLGSGRYRGLGLMRPLDTADSGV